MDGLFQPDADEYANFLASLHGGSLLHEEDINPKLFGHSLSPDGAHLTRRLNEQEMNSANSSASWPDMQYPVSEGITDSNQLLSGTMEQKISPSGRGVDDYGDWTGIVPSMHQNSATPDAILKSGDQDSLPGDVDLRSTSTWTSDSAIALNDYSGGLTPGSDTEHAKDICSLDRLQHGKSKSTNVEAGWAEANGNEDLLDLGWPKKQHMEQFLKETVNPLCSSVQHLMSLKLKLEESLRAPAIPEVTDPESRTLTRTTVVAAKKPRSSKASSPVQATGPVQGKLNAAHNKVEKRYRTNLNTKFAALRDGIPQFRAAASLAYGSTKAEDGEGGSVDGENSAQNGSPTSKGQPNKASILDQALEYISTLEKRNEQLGDENGALRASVNMFYKYA